MEEGESKRNTEEILRNSNDRKKVENNKEIKLVPKTQSMEREQTIKFDRKGMQNKRLLN